MTTMEQKTRSRASVTARQEPATTSRPIGVTPREFAFPSATADVETLEARYRSALAAWKGAVKTVDPNDARDRQRLGLLEKAYLESLSAVEAARERDAAQSQRLSRLREQRLAAERTAEMILSQHEAWAAASRNARRRRGLIQRLLRRD
jgi:hypothetical protein